MYATYTATTPGMKLNIRNAPKGDCVGELADGTTKPIEKAERGWCELAEGEGFIDARFVAITAEPPAGDEAAELRKMTNPQLYKLAENSGIKVKKGMNKDALIAAILAGSDD